MTSAATATVPNSAVEARSPGTAKHGAATISGIATSPDEAVELAEEARLLGITKNSATGMTSAAAAGVVNCAVEAWPPGTAQNSATIDEARNPNVQCRLMKLGFQGPDQMARPRRSSRKIRG